MKVSVLMITYNHEPYVAQAVLSALGQRTTFDFEIVVGDDCSTDGTRTILEDLRKDHPERLRLLESDRNIGMHRNLVRTLAACNGEYVALLEGDDYWTSPDKLQKQADFLDSHPGCAICFHGVNVKYEDGNRGPTTHPTGPQEPFSTIGDLFGGTSMQTGAVMFRNRLISEFPAWFYDLKMADWPLHILNARHGDIGYIDKIMGVYRVHSEGVWSSQRPEWTMLETIRAVDAANRHFGLEYTHRADGLLASCYFKLAGYYDLEGRRTEARSYFLRSLGARPFDRALTRGRIALGVKLYAPALHSVAKRIKWRLSRATDRIEGSYRK